MKILLIGRAIKDRSLITNYSDMQSYYISRALNSIGVETDYFSTPFTNVDEYYTKLISAFQEVQADHIVALGVRFFSRLPKELGAKISLAIDGLLCQIHDGSLFDDFPCDLNFTIREDEWRYIGNENNRLTRHHKRNWHIGWAADSAVFYPQQSSETLRVFVDHPTFVANSLDATLNVFMSLKELRDNYFVKKGEYLGFKKLEVKALHDDGVVSVDLDNICIRPYFRTPIPMDLLASEFRQAHLFFVTHAESVGMCAIESAMAGAFVYAPLNAINPDRLKTIRHAEFKNAVDWNGLTLRDVNSESNSLYARSNNWESVACKLVMGLIEKTPSLIDKKHFSK
jgi:hypothetical protein